MLSHKLMVRNILNIYNSASPSMVEDGATWYYKGNLLIQDISSSTLYPVENVAAAMAHLSPRVQWIRNVAATWALCSGQDRLSGIMSRSWNMAFDALESDEPLATLNGPKVKRFADNLLLVDMNAVTVDIWAVRCACGKDENIKIKGAYEKIEKAYQSAALTLGVDASTVQAVTWVAYRNGRSK